jgi:hypothetical protein
MDNNDDGSFVDRHRSVASRYTGFSGSGGSPSSFEGPSRQGSRKHDYQNIQKGAIAHVDTKINSVDDDIVEKKKVQRFTGLQFG